MEKGKNEKLIFTAYSDNKFEKLLSDRGTNGSYIVMVNPSSISRNFTIEYDKAQATNSTSTSGKHKKTKPESWSFDFIIDGTGICIAENDEKATVVDHWIVTRQIESFISVVYKYISEDHRHPYVKIEYCGLVLKGVLNSLDINYSLFYPDGLPLRAKITCKFGSAINYELAAIKEDNKSPDMTHYRALKDGETLISKVYEIYRSIDYYSEVARKNDLNNFRKIERGTPLSFPPIEK